MNETLKRDSKVSNEFQFSTWRVLLLIWIFFPLGLLVQFLYLLIKEQDGPLTSYDIAFLYGILLQEGVFILLFVVLPATLFVSLGAYMMSVIHRRRNKRNSVSS